MAAFQGMDVCLCIRVYVRMWQGKRVPLCAVFFPTPYPHFFFLKEINVTQPHFSPATIVLITGTDYEIMNGVHGL